MDHSGDGMDTGMMSEDDLVTMAQLLKRRARNP